MTSKDCTHQVRLVKRAGELATDPILYCILSPFKFPKKVAARKAASANQSFRPRKKGNKIDKSFRHETVPADDHAIPWQPRYDKPFLTSPAELLLLAEEYERRVEECKI